MTKKPVKVVKNKSENIHSLYNQEFRYPSLTQRLLDWIFRIIVS